MTPAIQAVKQHLEAQRTDDSFAPESPAPDRDTAGSLAPDHDTAESPAPDRDTAD